MPYLEEKKLNNTVVSILKEKGLKLSSAESATGGLFAKSITDVSGASAVFDTSYVTYSNNSKINNLGVKAETIDKYSVSSKEVALEMVQGVIKNTGSDVAVAITGNAGPDVYDGQHAGLAFIGYAFGDNCGTITVDTGMESRDDNRLAFKDEMLKAVLNLIK